jgi:hypothetical protein
VQGKYRCDWNQPVQRARKTSLANRNSSASPISRSPVALASAAPHKSQINCSASPADARDVLQVPFTQETTSPSIDQAIETYSGQPQDGLRLGLPPSHLPLANAIMLNEQDLQAFMYVPKSLMVLRFGKPWQWSMLSYVHSRIACREAGVMRSFIALASMELRFLELLKFQETTPSPGSFTRIRQLKDAAMNHLNFALQDLSSILDRLSGTQSQSDDIEALFSMWFLILHVGLYDPGIVNASRVHLKGIRSFLQRYVDGDVAQKQDNLPPVAQQLLLFIA